MLICLKFFRAFVFCLLLVLGGWSLTDWSLQSADDTFQTPADEQIVGGRDAIPGEYPWQAYLEIAQSSLCGGSLISEEWVVTAAHCVVIDGVVQTNVTIVLGEHQLSQTDNTEEVRQASSVIPHAQYNEQSSDNDIALIKLDAPVAFTSAIAPISLLTSPTDDNLVAVGTLSTVSGWGALQENGDIADVLQTVAVPIVSNSTCNAAYSGKITNNMLCAGYVSGGKDSCQGDSGGPLVVPSGGSWKQAGVVSFGRGCARAGRYGVYTRISRYIDWINSTTGNLAATPTNTPAPPTPTATATIKFTPTPSPTPSATTTATPTATPWSESSSNYLRNGDFEAGPNGQWSESSNHYGGIGGLILKPPALGLGIAPIGLYAARLGGVDAEQASLSQYVTLPAGGGARLRFFYRLLSDENQCGDDRVLLRANNNTVAVINLCQANQNADWQEAVYDFSAYVGQSFTLQFIISSDDQSISRLVLDNMTLRTGATGNGATPTATPDPAGPPNGNFEAGPNGKWYEQVGPMVNPGVIIINAHQAPVDAGPNTGNYLAWLGGGNLTHSTILSQTFDIANDPPVTLLYNYQVRSQDTCDGGTMIQRSPDAVFIQVYGASPFTMESIRPLCRFGQTHNWQQWQSLDVSAYAGQKITLKFSLSQDPFAPSALLLDNIAVASAHAPQIRLAATTFDFYATTIDSQSAPQRLTVYSGISNTWVSTAPTANWLTVQTPESALPQNLELTVNPALAGQGVHTATFQVQAGTQSVPVQARLFVGATGLAQVNPAALSLQAHAGATGIRLAWQPSKQHQVMSYRILRQENNDPWVVVGQQQIELAWQDLIGAGAQLGKKYCYQVEAVDGKGMAVVGSNQACASAGALALWAPYVTAKLGEVVEAPISLANADGLRLVQGGFRVRYNPEVLHYQAFATDLPAASYTVQVTPEDAETLIVTVKAGNAADPLLLAGPRTLLTLRFATLTDGYPKSDLALQPYPDSSTGIGAWVVRTSSNAASIPVHFTEGVVAVQAAPHYQRGDTNGDGAVTAADTTWLLGLVTAEPATAAGAQQQSALVAGDVNNNSQLDAGDGVRIRHYAQTTTWPGPAADALAAHAAAPVAMTLALADNTMPTPETATITLQGSQLAAFAGGEAVIVYDPQVVERVSQVESLLPGAEVQFVDNQRGQLMLAWVNNTAAQGDLALLRITLQLRPSAIPPASHLLLAAARLYDTQGHDLVRSTPDVTLARTHGWIGTPQFTLPLFLPLVQR